MFHVKKFRRPFVGKSYTLDSSASPKHPDLFESRLSKDERPSGRVAGIGNQPASAHPNAIEDDRTLHFFSALSRPICTHDVQRKIFYPYSKSAIKSWWRSGQLRSW